MCGLNGDAGNKLCNECSNFQKAKSWLEPCCLYRHTTAVGAVGWQMGALGSNFGGKLTEFNCALLFPVVLKNFMDV